MELDFDTSTALQRFNKAYVGKVKEVGMTYNIQDLLDIDGFFGVKGTTLGKNLCLMEDRDEGAVERLLENDKPWVERWFAEVFKWKPEVWDSERVVWVRLFGLP